ncbi:transmembrane protein 200B [Varanus komodoensis]|uniref:Transmembrane protein 200B n=1 Tax=Varanus komodoensis TaxID=61221 RepID=A0A8D2JBC5_VARKO|nr:transmembrane protein 200B [Varanus komodoensis]XP_044291118.1 transmembrane protein 200B [Varanus komodoensis]
MKMTMATAGSAEPKGAMKSHNPPGKKQPAGPTTSAPSRWRRRRFRCQAPSEASVKGQLRMRSPSGAFVMVGVSVVLVGMIIAVIGYWPHRTRPGASRPGSANATDEIKKEVRVSPHPRLSPHSEKLKLIGPVIMGIGLFIFICANTLLYENRDMETRLLMQRELYSMSLKLPPDASQASSYFQRRPLPSTPQASAEGVEGCYEVDLSSSGFQSCSSPVRKWANSYGSNRLQTTTQFLHHKSVSPALSLLSVRSDSGNALQENRNLSFAHGPESVISSAVNALSLPLFRLNTCLLENRGISRVVVRDLEGNCVRLPEEQEEVLRLSWTLLPGCNSVTPRKDKLQGNHIVLDMDSESPSASSVEKSLHPDCTKREFSSDTQIPNAGHSKSLDLGQPGVVVVAPVKDRRHRSWPRLDHIGLVNYAKLESRGDSSDRLLDTSRDAFPDDSRESSQEVVMETGSRA